MNPLRLHLKPKRDSTPVDKSILKEFQEVEQEYEGLKGNHDERKHDLEKRKQFNRLTQRYRRLYREVYGRFPDPEEPRCSYIITQPGIVKVRKAGV